MSGEVKMRKTLSAFIWKHGAPNALFSDNAKVITSETVLDILRHYNIGQMFSEPEQQNQNPCERRIQEQGLLSMSFYASNIDTGSR
jgi:transposase InsO family protein